ncbi:MAG: ornithine cyclodeaminase [Anaerolineae bacterium]|nr:ornithine cyclodeaminase [Anaerolineae bacterium]
MHILDAAAVSRAVSMREAIDAVREGFIALSTGRANVPVRGVLPVNGNTTLTMSAYIHGSPVSTVKVVSVYPDNPQVGLPTVLGSVLVLDATTGVPLALLDGASLTALRTGAASGLATDLLALPDAHVLGVIGAGKQARTQVEAVYAVRPIDQIRVYSLNGAEAFAQELREQYEVAVHAAADLGEALRGAQVVVAATNSRTPVVHLEHLQPGAHVNGVGSFRPDMQEVAADVVARAKVVVDHRESVWHEAGDLIIPHDQGLIPMDSDFAEIGEVAAGLRPGRTSPDAITFFKSVGNAVQDVAVAARVVASLHI